MSTDHIIPLPSQAIKLLCGMKTITGDRKHLFPHRDNRLRPMTAATWRQMLKVLGWAGKFSPHATRTTGSTRLNELNFRSDWIEKQFAHTEQNTVRGTYNHADFMEGRTQIMQQWADLLDEWKKDDSKVVLPKQDAATRWKQPA